MKTASVLDYPKNSLDPQLFDSDNEMKDVVVDEILDVIESFLDDFSLPTDALLDALIYGSILTNQWNKKTDIDCRIVLDPDKVHAVYPDLTGDDLFELARPYLHSVPILDTQHPLNCSVILEGEDTELAQTELGQTEEDPVYNLLNRQYVVPPYFRDEAFDPEDAFTQEKDDVEEVMSFLDDLIRETKKDAIDYQVLEEAVIGVRDSDKLVQRLEQKVEELTDDITKLTQEYEKIKTDRSEGYKEDRHFSPKNIKYKYLERYNYLDVLRKLKKILEDGIQKEEINEIVEVTK